MAQHFLVVTLGTQGHVNPALHLCRRLALYSGTTVTFSTAISSHRCMFQGSSDQVHDGLISYIPFSDGYDDGFNSKVESSKVYKARSKSFGSRTLSAIIRSVADRGQPVTCIIYTMLFSWVGDVARDHGLPSAAYWIQPATVFAIYYEYFHGHDGLIKAHSRDPHFPVSFPGLFPLKIRDLPSLICSSSPDDSFLALLEMFEDMFNVLDRQQEAGSAARMLVNTFDELEANALAGAGKVKLIPIGPALPDSLLESAKEGKGTESKGGGGGDLLKGDEKRYMEWLDSQEEKSVVYVSFGSISVVKKRQAEEILRGLRASGRPYLWVVREDNRRELEWSELGEEEEEGKGIVVRWCSQLPVLSHKAVGCFVTHCGWNSTLESLACGVPTVAVPQWSDQATNAMLMEMWGTGVRGEVDGEGILDGEELANCLEVVMGKGEKGEEIRKQAEMWKEKTRRAVVEGGSSDRNLRDFVEEMAAASSHFRIE